MWQLVIAGGDVERSMTEKEISRSWWWTEASKPITVNLSKTMGSAFMVGVAEGAPLFEVTVLFNRIKFDEATVVGAWVMVAFIVVSEDANGSVAFNGMNGPYV